MVYMEWESDLYDFSDPDRSIVKIIRCNLVRSRCSMGGLLLPNRWWRKVT